MFPLHDKTRRYLCRTVFLIAGVAPMLAAIAWATTVNSVAHLKSVREQLAGALDMEVRLAKVSYPRPGVTLLEGLELADPETGENVASMRLVEMTDDEHGQTLILSQPEINAARLDRLWPAINQRLRVHDNANQNTIRISAAEVTLRWSGGMETLTDCSAQFESTGDGNAVAAAFRLANVPSSEPLRLQLVRSSRAGQSSTAFDLDTNNVPLPCPLVSVLLQRENHLGLHSTLRGKLQADETPDGLQAGFSGRLEQVDLNAAVTDQFPHQLSGTAEVTINKSEIHAGRLMQCEGTIHAGPGVVSPSLLASSAESLGMKRGFAENVQSNSGGGVAAYEELSAAFRLDAKGLTIRGSCGGDTGVVIRSKEGILLAESTDGPMPMAALVKTLVPDSRVQVPATRQTDWLLHVLPVPDVVPHDSQSPPQARLHGRDYR